MKLLEEITIIQHVHVQYHVQHACVAHSMHVMMDLTCDMHNYC